MCKNAKFPCASLSWLSIDMPQGVGLGWMGLLWVRKNKKVLNTLMKQQTNIYLRLCRQFHFWTLYISFILKCSIFKTIKLMRPQLISSHFWNRLLSSSLNCYGVNSLDSKLIASIHTANECRHSKSCHSLVFNGFAFSFFPHLIRHRQAGICCSTNRHSGTLRQTSHNEEEINRAQKAFQRRNVHNKPSLKLRALHNLHQFTAKTTGSIATRAMRAGAEYSSSNKNLCANKSTQGISLGIMYSTKSMQLGNTQLPIL